MHKQAINQKYKLDTCLFVCLFMWVWVCEYVGGGGGGLMKI